MADIPDYYKQFAQKPKPPAPAPAAPRAPQPEARAPGKAPAPRKEAPPLAATSRYLAGTFSLDLVEDWNDRTLHTIAGPFDDGLQHNILIDIEREVGTDDLHDYSDRQVKALEESLKACRVLKNEPVLLRSGLPAYRAIFCWYPVEEVRVYQEQVYVLAEDTAYKLTATFTRKSRKTIGPLVEQMMLSFTPGMPFAPPPGSARY